MRLFVTRRTTIRAAAAALGLAAAAASGQDDGTGVKRVEAPIRPLEPVDATIEDWHSLSTSLRVREGGLHEPSGFSQVFRFSDDQGQQLLMRADGGLYAVFPNSVYVPTRRRGLVPVIPAGTEFFIGPPRPALASTAAAAGRRYGPDDPQPLGRRIDARIGDSGRAADEAARTSTRRNPVARTGGSPVTRSIATDETYRLQRLRTLLERATRGN